MRFGLNLASIAKMTLHRDGACTLHFDVKGRHALLTLNDQTDKRLIANLKYALFIEEKFSSIRELCDRIWLENRELYVFLHYHNEVPEGKQVTFLHIAGTLKDGAVFERYTHGFLPYMDNGKLVYKDPKSGESSIVSRSKEYMEGPNTRPKGTILSS